MTATSELRDSFDRGERRALARFLTIVEGGREEDAITVIDAVQHRTGRARVIGMTGPPGVGKSTLTSALTAELRSSGRTVAVLAVDPSSPYSGGAVLGDRIRMQSHQGDAGVFIRSMASKGRLGGLSPAATSALLVLDAWGFDDVVVETVGVGQSEMDIAALADVTVVALAPNMGDGVQAAKAGILEAADVFVVNKADHPGAERLVADLRGMISLGERLRPSGPGDGRVSHAPIVAKTIASSHVGVGELAVEIDRLVASSPDDAEVERRHRKRVLRAIREIVFDRMAVRFEQFGSGNDRQLETLAERVFARQISLYEAANTLLTVRLSAH